MRPLGCVKDLSAGLLATLLLTTGGMLGAAPAAQSSPALTADHVIACIRTAVAAHTGEIKDVEVDYERGQWLCEVELVDETGQAYELSIDMATYRVVKTERDDTDTSAGVHTPQPRCNRMAGGCRYGRGGPRRVGNSRVICTPLLAWPLSRVAPPTSPWPMWG